MKLPLSVDVEEVSQVGTSRRLAEAWCRELGFSETRAAEVALVVTELATNLVKHTAGAGGTLVFQAQHVNGGVSLDILSLDQGPGIRNIAECLRDGYSTTGSPGTGLGAIRRLSSDFDLYSKADQGLAVFARLLQGSPPATPGALAVGAVCLPVKGEEECGDAWSMKMANGSTLFMLVDGIGHGPEAAHAAKLAVDIFEKNAPASPAKLLKLIHAGLQGTRGTRGAVLAVAELSLAHGVLRFAGIGNIVAMIVEGQSCRNLVSYNGTAGYEVRKIHEFSHPWPADGILLMHSDGLDTRWNLSHYPGLVQRHPSLIAGVLFRDRQRLRDDSAVLVAKQYKAVHA